MFSYASRWLRGQFVIAPPYIPVSEARGFTAELVSGDARGSLALFQQLLPDQERVLGKDHPDTLTSKYWLDQLSDNQS